MKQLLIYSLILASCTVVSGQRATEIEPHCKNEKFDQEVKKYASDDVTLIDVQEVHERPEEFIILDAREKEEYKVSHIPGAGYVGYDHFHLDKVDDLDKNKSVVVYCSIGYRSGKIGELLKKAGFMDVYNMYGSIFEWVNRGYPVENLSGEETNRLHTYNRKWSQWVLHPDIEKVW